MNILMVTNTFTPHVGGVARSVASFSNEFRSLGHSVLTIAPEFDGAADDEPDVIRAPAISNFNGSDFSLPFVVPGLLAEALDAFRPDVIHSHHPFFLGSTAMRLAAARGLPLVFTHHTRYETYTHYVPADSPFLKRFVVDLAVGYCNLADAVIAPSESMAELLRSQGVSAWLEVIPTGVELDRFGNGKGDALRRRLGLDEEAFVVGHVGRLAQEKNLGFLAEAVAAFLERCPRAHFVVVGQGPAAEEIQSPFAALGLTGRLHALGALQGEELSDAYDAMDVFAFSSQSETQGMVLAEAMAAGLPVVAVNAPGVRDVVRDGHNGRLLPEESIEEFCRALDWIQNLPPAQKQRLAANLERTAEEFSMSRSGARMIEVYQSLLEGDRRPREIDPSPWSATLRWVEQEWRLVANAAGAVGHALVGSGSEEK